MVETCVSWVRPRLRKRVRNQSRRQRLRSRPKPRTKLQDYEDDHYWFEIMTKTVRNQSRDGSQGRDSGLETEFIRKVHNYHLNKANN